MNVLHTVAGLWTTPGGPAASVSGLCRALSERGHDVTVLTGAGPLAPEVEQAAESISVRTAPLGPYLTANFSRAFARACREEATRSEVVHTHGVWLHPNWTSAAAARALGKPLAISPRGMLEPWSLERSKWRKRLLWRLVERRSFAGAALVHVTSAAEAQSVRAIGVETPVAVIPNGIDLEREFSETRLASSRAGSGSDSRPMVLYLGRIHPKKGLDILCDAWSRIESAAARLVICGGGERAHVEWLERRLAELGDPRVEYPGLVTGERKLRLLAEATVLVVPSRSENYGMVIAEALASRTPVIASTATPWQSLVDEQCGWWVEPRAEAVASALEQALELGSTRLEEMGDRGRRLIENEHSLARAADMMEQAYRWITRAGDRPEWIL